MFSGYASEGYRKMLRKRPRLMKRFRRSACCTLATEASAADRPIMQMASVACKKRDMVGRASGTAQHSSR